MKKDILFSIAIALGFMAVFAACLKDSENPNAPIAIKDPVPVTDEGVADRGLCSKTVTIGGAAGLYVCGNYNFGVGGCTGCSSAYDRIGPIESSNYTTTMLSSCFTLINDTNSARSVGFTVAGNSGICPITGGYSVPAHGSATFCIVRVGSCCQVTSADCE